MVSRISNSEKKIQIQMPISVIYKGNKEGKMSNSYFKISKQFSLVGLLLIALFCLAPQQSNGQTEKDKVPKEKKAKTTKNSDRKATKGSNKSFDHKNGDPTLKQKMDKDKAGVKKKRKKKRSKKAEKFSSKKSKKGSKKNDKSSDEFSATSNNRKKTANTKSDDFTAKSKNRTKIPRVVPDDTGMTKSSKSKDYKKPLDLNKTTVKVPVMDHRKSDLKRYRNSDKLQTVPVPPRQNKPNMDDTYMVKVKRKHSKKGLPNQNPVEIRMSRSKAKDHKNLRPEIDRWKGNYKKPIPLYQKFLDWKKARKIQDPSQKLYTVKVTTGRKNYRKNGRAIAMWTGDLKVKRMPKHAHPSLRWQFYKHRPSSAEIGRNKRVKKPKYDPNEKKIWEPKDEYSTY